MKLNLFSIAALFITGLGSLMFGLTISQIIHQISGYSRLHNSSDNWTLLIFLLAIGFIIAGIMMFLRIKKSTTFVTLILSVSMISMLFYLFTIINKDFFRNQLFIYPYYFFIFIWLLTLTLFINNQKVISSIDDYEREEDLSEDILDKF